MESITRGYRACLLLAAVSTVFALLAVEVALSTWQLKQNTANAKRLAAIAEVCPGSWLDSQQCQAAFELGEPFNARSTREMLTALEAGGETWWPAIHATFFRSSDGLHVDGRMVMPLAGVSGANTLFCNESGTWATYVSDEHGFNSPTPVHARGAPLAVIGDSFVHGQCVAPDKTIPGALNATFPGVMGLGLAGAGPLVELAILREYVADVQPETVVWVFYVGNDLEDLLEEHENDILQEYLDPDYKQNLSAIQPMLDRALADTLLRLRTGREDRKAARNDLKRQRLSNASLIDSAVGILKLRSVRRVWRRATDRPVPAPFPEAQLRQVMETARDEVAGWGGEIAFVVVPDYWRYGLESPPDMHYEEVVALAREIDLEVIDVVSVFDSHPDPLSLFPRRTTAHYTPEGYAVVVDAIVRGLEQTTDAAGRQSEERDPGAGPVQL